MVGYLAVAHGSWRGVEVGWRVFSFYLFKEFSGVCGRLYCQNKLGFVLVGAYKVVLDYIIYTGGKTYIFQIFLAGMCEC
jgi:hypothetical protein